MKPQVTRRDFLKFAGLSLSALAGASFLGSALNPAPDSPNIIIILFDAMSARNLNLYGYPRNTSANITRFAKRATVYHAHHAPANYTSASTASLLTGTYAWTNRCFYNLPIKAMNTRNIFHALKGKYSTAGFAQNLLADLILDQFAADIDFHTLIDAYSEMSSPVGQAVNAIFPRDSLHANLGSAFYFANKNKAGSIFLTLLDKLAVQGKYKYRQEAYRRTYPNDLPYSWLNSMYFQQAPVMDGMATDLFPNLPGPFFSYNHLWSPHEPYRTTRKYTGAFNDGWKPVEKPLSHFGNPGLTNEILNQFREQYDEDIALVDAEFGRLVDYFETSGLFDNSYIIVTADHGDLFERGVQGHVTPLMYEGLLHIPLVISSPGQQARQDVYSLTSTVDLLPTLVNLSGGAAPDWSEGKLLPRLGGQEDAGRTVYSLQAKDTPAHSPIREATAVAIKGQHKLIHTFGYAGYEDSYELYNLADDPEELNNIYASSPEIAGPMQADLKQKLQAADQPYQ